MPEWEPFGLEAPKVIKGYIVLCYARACLKKAFCKMCVTICGRFCPDEGAVAGYGNRIRAKYTAKWGVQIAGMIFQTRSRLKDIWVVCMIQDYMRTLFYGFFGNVF